MKKMEIHTYSKRERDWVLVSASLSKCPEQPLLGQGEARHPSQLSPMDGKDPSTRDST